MRAVLVAGDSPVRTRLTEMLAELPFIQLEVQDPAVDPCEMVIQSHPDVVLVDIDQARGRGLSIIRDLRRQSGEYAPVIVALVSARPLRYRSSCLKAGAMYFFNTTRELEWLVAALESIRDQVGE